MIGPTTITATMTMVRVEGGLRLPIYWKQFLDSFNSQSVDASLFTYAFALHLVIFKVPQASLNSAAVKHILFRETTFLFSGALRSDQFLFREAALFLSSTSLEPSVSCYVAGMECRVAWVLRTVLDVDFGAPSGFDNGRRMCVLLLGWTRSWFSRDPHACLVLRMGYRIICFIMILARTSRSSLFLRCTSGSSKFYYLKTR